MKYLLSALLLLPSLATAESPLPMPVCSQLSHLMKYQWDTAVHMAETDSVRRTPTDCEKHTAEFNEILETYHTLLLECESGLEVSMSAMDIPAFSPSVKYFACNSKELPDLVKPFLETN
ncbi:MAG: hypothetical protein VX730_08280 [Pseudomonadota bacterium]|nr:hypothetical protein [Pseudomonadota bacterium]